MFRLVVALGLFIGYASSSVAADYEVNLSVLDNLEGVADNGFELPLPAAKEKNAVSAAKKISPDKFKKNSVQKKSVKAEKPKSKKTVRKTEKNILKAKKVLPSESKEEKQTVILKTEQLEDKITSEPEKPVLQKTVEPIAKNKNETSKTEGESLLSAPEPIAESEPKKTEKTVVAETEDKQVSTDEISKEKNDEKREVSKVGESSAMLCFSDSSAELNAEITDVLTLFLNKIGLQNQEKITIEAYNYNEEDSGFARKRLSLNRAVAVRGWLLAKGLKSFSVKIINTEDASFQNNVLVSY